MASAVPTNVINDRAAEWAVESAHGDMTPESHAALEAWLAADTLHRGAYVRACAWLRAMEDAVVETGPPPAATSAVDSYSMSIDDPVSGHGKVAARPLRRVFYGWTGRAAAGGAALAMSLAALIALGVPITGLFDKAEHSAVANRVNLKDGSVARLDRGAQIQVAMSNSIRKITLLSGEATFDVAKDKTRPFVVRSGDVYAQATGTVFSVSRSGSIGGTVKVIEGSVLVWPRDERDQAVLLHAGGKLTLDPGPLATGLELQRSEPRRLPPPELAQISLDNVSVRSAVVRFNRVNTAKIVLADPAIGDITIIGLYRANDPEHFADAVAAISGGRVEHAGRTIVIKMK